jgi:hypothetical protein
VRDLSKDWKSAHFAHAASMNHARNHTRPLSAKQSVGARDDVIGFAGVGSFDCGSSRPSLLR